MILEVFSNLNDSMILCYAMKSHPTRLWKLVCVVFSIYRICTRQLQRILLIVSLWNRAPIGIKGFFSGHVVCEKNDLICCHISSLG